MAQPAQPKESRFCASCSIHPPPHRMQDDLKGEACSHKSSTCTICWQDWLQQQLDSQHPNQIQCMECPTLLTQADIRKLASPTQYNRYLDLTLKSSLSTLPDFHLCMAKSCPSGQFHHDGEIFECVACSHKHCVPCSMPWHPEISCEGARRNRDADAASKKIALEHAESEHLSEKWAESTAKPCPGCERRIEKIGGCEHMTCSMCAHEFCWLCFADYRAILEEGNHLHNPNCEFWADPGDGSFGLEGDVRPQDAGWG